ncbi:unnamed protein product [Blepharisma stoltei]|uniref:Peptidase M20 dimerisation domain-containing protein n=1 Tax=Blepharisma stoltei TaxID=1481888 RepID=A0AAU9K8X0_9CILI|nr:unnamed protein product [Blepharisma stoltei]
MEGLNIHPEVAELYPELLEIRRGFHKNPELLFELPKTSAFIIEYLQSLNIEVHTEVGKIGVVGVIRGEGPCILLRADMDALPIEELKESDYKSSNPGAMHACGHDAHMAMLLVAAKVISRHRDKVKGSIKFMFQPAEEGGHGARFMRDDPLYPILDSEPRVDEVYAIHVEPQMKSGDFFCSDKFSSSCCDDFSIEIHGKGGHGSAPFLCIDPVVIASELVLALQTIVPRNINTKYQSVISVCSIKAGETYNAIPDSCILLGTIRTYEKEVREQIIQRATEICEGLGIANNTKITFKIDPGYGAIINDPKCIEKSVDTFKKVSPNAVRYMGYPMYGEDFSYLTDVRPGCFIGLGCNPGERGAVLHSPNFNIDERAMMIGSSWFIQLINDQLCSNEDLI